MAVRNGVDRAGAHAFTDKTAARKGRRQFVEQPEGAFIQPDIDDLAAPGRAPRMQRGQHAERRIDSRDIVRQRRGAGRRRRPVGGAAQIGDAAEGIGDAAKAGAVAIGAGLAIGRHPGDDQPRVDRLQCVGTKPPAFERAGLEIFDQHIGLGGETFQRLGPVRGAQVELDRALVAALAEPDQGVAAVGPGAEAADRVADAGKFDLDDIGAEFGEIGGAIGPGDEGGEIEYLETCEGAVRCATGGAGFVHDLRIPIGPD